MNLRDKVNGHAQRSCYQLRKARHKKGEVHKTFEGFQLTEIDVQGVAPGLKSKKGNAYG